MEEMEKNLQKLKNKHIFLSTTFDEAIQKLKQVSVDINQMAKELENIENYIDKDRDNSYYEINKGQLTRSRR